MDKKFIESMQKKLLSERAIILESLEKDASAIKAQVKETGSGDIVDVASDVVDSEIYHALSSQDSNRLSLIDGALDRIQQEKYGTCLKCGKEIPQARLKAQPFAVMCITCTEEAERQGY